MKPGLTDEELYELTWKIFEVHAASVHGGETEPGNCHACTQLYATVIDMEAPMQPEQDTDEHAA